MSLAQLTRLSYYMSKAELKLGQSLFEEGRPVTHFHVVLSGEVKLTARAAGLLCHAGHGLSYESLGPVAAMPEVVEVSIGHFLIGRSVFEGLPAVVRRFKALIGEARRGP